VLLFVYFVCIFVYFSLSDHSMNNLFFDLFISSTDPTRFISFYILLNPVSVRQLFYHLPSFMHVLFIIPQMKLFSGSFHMCIPPQSSPLFIVNKIYHNSDPPTHSSLHSACPSVSVCLSSVSHVEPVCS